MKWQTKNLRPGSFSFTMYKIYWYSPIFDKEDVLCFENCWLFFFGAILRCVPRPHNRLRGNFPRPSSFWQFVYLRKMHCAVKFSLCEQLLRDFLLAVLYILRSVDSWTGLGGGGAWIASINCCQNCCQIKLRLLHLQRQVWRIIGGHCPPAPQCLRAWYTSFHFNSRVALQQSWFTRGPN